MNVTKNEIKDRKLHKEDYLQMVSAEQKEYAEVSTYVLLNQHRGIYGSSTSFGATELATI